MPTTETVLVKAKPWWASKRTYQSLLIFGTVVAGLVSPEVKMWLEAHTIELLTLIGAAVTFVGAVTKRPISWN